MTLINRDELLTILKEHRALYCDNTPESFKKLDHSDKCRVDEMDTCIATIFNLSIVDFKSELEKIKAEAEELIQHCDINYDFEEIYGIKQCINILDKHIKELNNE